MLRCADRRFDTKVRAVGPAAPPRESLDLGKDPSIDEIEHLSWLLQNDDRAGRSVRRGSIAGRDAGSGYQSRRDLGSSSGRSEDDTSETNGECS